MLVRKALQVAASALLLAMLSSCTAMPGGARLDHDGPFEATRAFHGLVPAKEDGPGESSTRYIFVVHGMGATHEGYSTPLLEAIKALGYRAEEGQWVKVALPQTFTVEGEAFGCDGRASAPCVYSTFGRYRLDRFTAGAGLDASRVVVVTYYWDESMAALQSPFLQRDLDTRGGAALNTGLKHQIIDRGFGDATAYLGEAGGLARLGIEGAICAMLKDAAGKPVPVEQGQSRCRFADLTPEDAAAFKQIDYSFVSFSLGSRMLYDVLSSTQAASDGDVQARAGLALRTRNFFMLANQMPLLGIGKVKVTPPTATVSVTGDQGPVFVPVAPEEADGCRENFFVRSGCRRGPGATSDVAGVTPIADGLEVVAFHDPEDLLGFRASGGIRDAGATRFVEVSNRNTPVWLGVFADPAKAHATELTTSARNLILCGASSDVHGALRAGECVSH